MNDYIIPEEIRTKLGEYIKNIREQNGLGLNQLAVKIDVVSSLLSRLENGKVLKVNPFLLKKISEGLKIDYKELYKIVGYLDNNDLYEIDSSEKIKKLEKELEQYKNQLNVENNNNNGHIIVGDRNKINNSYAGTALCKELGELDEKQKEKVLKFINDYIKN